MATMPGRDGVVRDIDETLVWARQALHDGHHSDVATHLDAAAALLEQIEHQAAAASIREMRASMDGPPLNDHETAFYTALVDEHVQLLAREANGAAVIWPTELPHTLEELNERVAVRVLGDALGALGSARQALSDGQIADVDTHVAIAVALLENADDPRAAWLRDLRGDLTADVTHSAEQLAEMVDLLDHTQFLVGRHARERAAQLELNSREYGDPLLEHPDYPSYEPDPWQELQHAAQEAQDVRDDAASEAATTVERFTSQINAAPQTGLASARDIDPSADAARALAAANQARPARAALSGDHGAAARGGDRRPHVGSGRVDGAHRRPGGDIER